MTPTRHWIPILAIAGSIISYGYIVQGQNYSVSDAELFLVLLNLIFLVFAALRNAYTARTEMQKARARLKHKIQVERADAKQASRP